MKCYSLFVFMAVTFIEAAGSDVVIGILGNSVSIDCKLPVSESIIWESRTVGVIAINSELVVRRISKYAVETYNGARESLVIHDVTLTDEDEYRCYSVHDKQDVYVTFLNVLVRPQMNVTYPTEPVLEGTEVILACEADGGKPLPELKWYMLGPDGNVMKMEGVESSTLYANGTGHIASILKLNVSRAIYMTAFICDISVPVFYQEKMTLELDVHLTPEEPVIRGYTGSYDEDSEIKLECISTGNHPTPTMFWQINGSRAGDTEFVVIPESNKTSTVTSFLTRKLSRAFDGSAVTCAVRNSVVSARGLKPVSTNITLHMSYKPTVTVTDDHCIIHEGDDVKLECLIDSLPVTDINSVYWSQNGVLVDRGTQELSKNASGLYLQLTNVTRTDAGNYTCHVSNRLGNSFGQTKLSILHAPQCSTNKTQRIPVKLGNSVRLKCQMFAFPTTVMLYWRDKITKTIITSVPATKDNSTEGLVHGQIDMKILSRDQYSTLECIGTNTAIGDIQPCLYKIEPPTPAEAPIGCFVNTLHNKVSVTCNAGFDGGSRQVFILQTQVRSSFQTVLNSSSPQFDYISSTNGTIRVCSVNEDFKDVLKCSVQLAVNVFNTGHQDDTPVVARNANKMVYVGIGLVCFAGLMIIVTIVMLYARSRRKNTDFSSTPPVEEAFPNRRRHIQGLALGEKCWNNVRPANRPDLNANGSSTPPPSRTTRNGSQVVCSTPYHGNKQAVFNVEGNSPILQEDNLIQHDLQNMQSPEPINFNSFGESTGFNVNTLIYDSTYTDRSGLFLTINTLHSDEYNQNGSVLHKTSVAGVDNSVGEALENHKHEIADAQSIDMCAVTLDKDYSAGDIADILDKTEHDRNDKTFKLDNPNYDIVINGTSLSFNVDFSESDVCAQFSNMSPTELNSSRDLFDSDFKEEDTSSVSFSSTLGSQQTYAIADDATLCYTTGHEKNMNKTYTIPNIRRHPVRNSTHETEGDMSVALRSDLLEHMTKLSKRNSTCLNQHNGQYSGRRVLFQCGSDTDSGSDYCDEELCDVDQCILTLTNDSKQDTLEVEYDTIRIKETPPRNHFKSGVNRALSTKLRNNSFRTAIDNRMVDNTTTFPTGYTAKSDISATVMVETKEGTGYKDEDDSFNGMSSTYDGVAFF